MSNAKNNRRRQSIKQISEEDVKLLFEVVKNCSYVKTNPEYNKKAQLTEIKYEGNDNSVNAYAMYTGNDDGSDERYGISILAGLCNAMHLGSVAMADYDKNRDITRFTQVIKWIGELIRETGDFSFASVHTGIEKFNLKLNANILKETNSFLAGSIIDVIGHELGHIALSHVLRDDTGNSTSRNDERSADLFGFSVSDTTPFARYAIMGGLVMGIVFAWLDEHNSQEQETTHPYSRERVYNHVTSHREYLEDRGISMKNIDQFLP